MFMLMDKKIFTILRSNFLFVWIYDITRDEQRPGPLFQVWPQISKHLNTNKTKYIFDDLRKWYLKQSHTG